MIECNTKSCKCNENSKCVLKSIVLDEFTRCKNYEFDMNKAINVAYEIRKEMRTHK